MQNANSTHKNIISALVLKTSQLSIC